MFCTYDLHDHKLWNRARWQEPAFHKASDLTMIHRWRRRCGNAQALSQWNINSFMVKYVQIWNSILSPKNELVARYWFMDCVIPNTNNFYHARGFIRKKYWLVFILYWVTFWQSTQDNSSNDIKCIIRLWAESGNSSFITQKSHMISWSIFRTKLVKLGLMSCPDDL